MFTTSAGPENIAGNQSHIYGRLWRIDGRKPLAETRMMCFRHRRLRFALPWLPCCLLLAALGQGAVATIAPYTADGNTLFLFHFDEAAAGSTATNSGLLGGVACTVNMSSASTSPPLVTSVLGAAGYAGFGNAANLNTSGYMVGFDADNSGTYDGETAESIPMSLLNMGNGGQTPWTLEAMIYPSVTNANQEIITTDSSAASRGFQFRLAASGQLELNLIYLGADFLTAIPTTNADPVNGFAPNNWYHVAAAYDGTNVVLYWTKVSSSVVAANPISTNAVAVGAAFGAVSGPLVIGNENRAAAGENFHGLIDEVRISSVARAASQMLVSPDMVSASPTAISPANPVYVGTPVTLSATVVGMQPIAYFWQSDGGTGGVVWTNLPNSTTNIYTMATTGMVAGNYQFRLVATNSLGAFTNSPATLNLASASGPVLVADTAINPSTVRAGNPVLMSAAFAGNAPITCQWFFTTNGGGTALIPGATNTTYSIASAQTNNAGSYFLAASNNPPGLGSRTNSSTPATLIVTNAASASVTSSNLGMFCELLQHPEETSISAVAPKFGWIYQPSFRNDLQTGYRIIVASSQSLANAGTGDLWDSGIVSSAASINVPYAGAALQPGTNYFWRVQTVNSAGQPGAWSGIQQFNTASIVDESTDNRRRDLQTARRRLHQLLSVALYVPVAPVLVTTNSLGHWFIDFGNDAFGFATVHVNGNYAGTNISFGLGEMASGNIVNTSPGATIRYWSGSFTLQNGNLLYTNRSLHRHQRHQPADGHLWHRVAVPLSRTKRPSRRRHAHHQ